MAIQLFLLQSRSYVVDHSRALEIFVKTVEVFGSCTVVVVLHNSDRSVQYFLCRCLSTAAWKTNCSCHIKKLFSAVLDSHNTMSSLLQL